MGYVTILKIYQALHPQIYIKMSETMRVLAHSHAPETSPAKLSVEIKPKSIKILLFQLSIKPFDSTHDRKKKGKAKKEKLPTIKGSTQHNSHQPNKLFPLTLIAFSFSWVLLDSFFDACFVHGLLLS